MAGDVVSEEDRRALVAAARAVADSGLVVGSAGNLSLRRGDQVLITPRRARLAHIEPADCVPVALAGGAVDPGHRSASEPSSELHLHLAAYDATGAGAVVHTHSHFATVLSTLTETVPPIHYVTAGFGGAVRVAPYATFGSRELADGVAAALEGRTAALMANHGAVACGGDVDRAVEQARQLEWLCSVYWHARVLGSPALLDDADLRAVADQSRMLRYSLAEPA